MILKNYRSSSESPWTGTLLTRLFVFGAQPQIKCRKQHQSLVGICERVAGLVKDCLLVKVVDTAIDFSCPLTSLFIQIIRLVCS
uniref:Uncharacterized protein n=1 Tax=Salix viminalis TaxID=40686 RepID=A0A6N2KNK1_SALVM